MAFESDDQVRVSADGKDWTEAREAVVLHRLDGVWADLFQVRYADDDSVDIVNERKLEPL